MSHVLVLAYLNLTDGVCVDLSQHFTTISHQNPNIKHWCKKESFLLIEVDL